jgi:dihydropteroate synthase
MQAPIIVLNGKPIDLATPVVMAIVNATPDSFWTESRSTTEQSLMAHVDRAVADGAAIIDVGGCSTRPLADFPSEEEEWQRVSWALTVIRREYADLPLSVDTFRASVAERAVGEFGVALVNDVSGGCMDEKMLPTVAWLQVPYVLTHAYGFPNMQQTLPDDEKFLPSVLRYFAQKIAELRALGFDKEIIIDPGFGFGKTLEQNWSLLRNLKLFEVFNSPILAGLSRKSMLCKPLGITPDDALNATTAANMLALQGGAHILRVHDVKEAVQTIKIAERFLS